MRAKADLLFIMLDALSERKWWTFLSMSYDLRTPIIFAAIAMPVWLSLKGVHAEKFNYRLLIYILTLIPIFKLLSTLSTGHANDAVTPGKQTFMINLHYCKECQRMSHQGNCPCTACLTKYQLLHWSGGVASGSSSALPGDRLLSLPPSCEPYPHKDTCTKHTV